MRLEGRVAIVTSGERGIGRSECEEFAREGEAATVFREPRNGAGQTVSS